jgi:hypothetical protein
MNRPHRFLQAHSWRIYGLVVGNAELLSDKTSQEPESILSTAWWNNDVTPSVSGLESHPSTVNCVPSQVYRLEIPDASQAVLIQDAYASQCSYRAFFPELDNFAFRLVFSQHEKSTVPVF